MNKKISVIMPVHSFPKNFQDVRRHIHTATTPMEIIYVINTKLDETVDNLSTNETIINIQDQGRGYMMLEGVKKAKGEIILLLHADTLLPDKWDDLIVTAMKDKRIIGGGFSLTFDMKHIFLSLMLWYVKISTRLTKVLTGDRAMFVRRQPLQKNLSILKKPIMEDIALSKWMKKQGKIHFLKPAVITSADAFVKHGFFRQSFKIFKCIILYKTTGDTDKIYKYYYQK